MTKIPNDYNQSKMGLLICTQKIDRKDPVLGFFCNWVESLAKKFEKITVVCLHQGENNLPANVVVLPLVQEETNNPGIKLFSQGRRIIRFYKFIWQARNNYDVVFVHMNSEYIILGSLFWRIWRKGTALWYNHAQGNIRAKIAARVSNKIFCTSTDSFMAKYKKTRIMPVGVDVEKFKPSETIRRRRNSILFLGRIAPIKKLDLLIEALHLLKSRGVSFTASIYGNPTAADENYYLDLKKSVRTAGLEREVSFYVGIPNYQTPAIYASHDIFVNLSPDGLYDKTIFEAMAAGNLVISAHSNLRSKIDPRLMLEERNSKKLAAVLETVLNLDDKDRVGLRNDLRYYVVQYHDLEILANRLEQELSSLT